MRAVRADRREDEAAHVLVIDDDRLIRDALTDVLTAAGYRVTAAEDGTAGLRRFADGHYHVIVTDVRMPGPDGWEVARRAREASTDVAIVVMSAGLDRSVPAGDGDARRLATLPKPFELDELVDIIDRLTCSSGTPDGV
jgi:DNA-binding response OmpR family regulator